MEDTKPIASTCLSLIRVLSDVVGRENLYFLPNGQVFTEFAGDTILANTDLGGFVRRQEVFGPYEFLQLVSPSDNKRLMATYRKGIQDLPLGQRRGTNELDTSFDDFSFRDLGVNNLTLKYLDFFKDRSNYFFEQQPIEKRNCPMFPQESIDKYPRLKNKLQNISTVHVFTRLFGNKTIKPTMFKSRRTQRYTSAYCPWHKNDQKNALIIDFGLFCFGCGQGWNWASGAALGKYFDGDVRNLKNFLKPYYELNNPELEGLPKKIEELSTESLFGLLIMKATEGVNVPELDYSF